MFRTRSLRPPSESSEEGAASSSQDLTFDKAVGALVEHDTPNRKGSEA